MPTGIQVIDRVEGEIRLGAMTEISGTPAGSSLFLAAMLSTLPAEAVKAANLLLRDGNLSLFILDLLGGQNCGALVVVRRIRRIDFRKWLNRKYGAGGVHAAPVSGGRIS